MNLETTTKTEIVMLPIDQLYAHPDNPRKNPGDLTELADSIRVKGILQNLTVVPGHYLTSEEREELSKLYDDNPTEELRQKLNTAAGGARKMVMDGYTIIIGHRRCAAAKLAGLTVLPCIIANMNEEEQISVMLLENIQRSDLTPIEQAQGFRMMLDFGETPETVAEKTGFSQSTVRQRVKLLELKPETLQKASDQQISMQDLYRLNQIKDITQRNTVLESYGSNNFEHQYLRAMYEQKNTENLNQWKAALLRHGVTELPTGPDLWNGRYGNEGIICIQYSEESLLKLIAGGKKYYFAISNDTIYLRSDPDSSQKADDHAIQELQEEADVMQKRIQDASQRAYELRYQFMKNFGIREAKTYVPAAIQTLLKHTWKPKGVRSYISYRYDAFSDLLGIDMKKSGSSFTYEVISEQSEKHPELTLLWHIYAMFNDSAYNNYYHAIRHTDKKQDDIYYEINHSENPTLDLLYSYLTDLGYQMSDEELALQDGTSGYFCSRRITASETADTTAENTEFTAISSYLEACKLCDITVQYDNGVFSATDGETTWTRAEFYGFLVNDVIRLDENEKPIHGYSMPDEILQPILRYAKEAGTAIQTQKNVMDSNSAELSPTDTEKMLDRIRENYDALMTDRFYIDSEKQQIKWSYFTSSAAGGMIVEHFITFSDVRKAAKNEQEDNFYSSLLQSAVSQQTEVSEPEFQQTYYHFLVDSYDSLDADEETMEYLISCVSSDNTTDTSDVDAILESLQDMYKKVYN